jgi:hypothetical protein
MMTKEEEEMLTSVRIAWEDYTNGTGSNTVDLTRFGRQYADVREFMKDGRISTEKLFGRAVGIEGSPWPTKSVAVVDFGDRRVAYTKSDAYDLQLAYAITIHSSQGSQFDAVIFPVDNSHQFMLTKPLIYTAITRATKFIYMPGQVTTLRKGIKNERELRRRTSLRQSIIEKFGGPTPEALSSSPAKQTLSAEIVEKAAGLL